jgi:predicted ATPase
LLAALVDKSLVIFEELAGQMRYRMLEMIRQYAPEKLDESGQAAQVSARHLEFLLRLAERAEPGFQSADQKLWFDCIEIEHDNLRAALEWATTNHKAEELLRLTGALWRFWWKHGHPAEGRKWLGLALELGSALPARQSDELGRSAGLGAR